MAPLGAYLGPTWGILAPLCHSFGLSCDPQGSPGLSLAVICLLLASHRAPLGVILIPLGDIHVQLGVSWTLFATHRGSPAFSRALHGPPGLSLAVLGLLLAPHRDHIMVYWRYLVAILCKCGCAWRHLGPTWALLHSHPTWRYLISKNGEGLLLQTYDVFQKLSYFQHIILKFGTAATTCT